MTDKPRFSGRVPRADAERQPTMAEIAGRIESLGSELAEKISDAEYRLGLKLERVEEDLSRRIGNVQQELSLTRLTQAVEQTRLADVEQKTRSIVPSARKAGKYGAIALAIPVILQIASELKPNLAGPLQTLIELFK